MKNGETAPFVDFEGRIVVVSGASSGFGRGIAAELARRGARLILLGRDEARLAETARQVESAVVTTLCFDLEQVQEIGPRLRQGAAGVGPIYGLCHSAGIVETRPLGVCTVEGVQRMLNVNLLAGLELARTVSRRDWMGEGGGSIVLVASVYGSVGVAGEVGYAASKGGVIAGARAMAVELARRNIRVNTLSPGFVETRMTQQAFAQLPPERVQALRAAHPLGVGTVEAVAHAAVFLLAPQTNWITGTDLVVDGGYSAH